MKKLLSSILIVGSLTASSQLLAYQPASAHAGNELDSTITALQLLVDARCLKLNKLPISQGGFRDMLEALGQRETGLRPGDPNQYKKENPLGFIGKYQFGEALLIDLGYYKADVYYNGGQNGVDKNYWRGAWTGKNGANSKQDFMNNPQIQETAIREAFRQNVEIIKRSLSQQGKSLNNYLGSTKTLNGQQIKITLSGILAGAHLRGPYGVANVLLKDAVSYDEFGTSILQYMSEFSVYNVTEADF
jgi:hypothetical protein